MAINLDQFEIIDITPQISSKLAVWPGDQAFERKESLSFTQGHNLVLSSIESTVHLGAHTDAPNHYHPDGKGIESRELKLYLGDCQVIDVEISPGTRILPKDLKVEIQAKRVLFKTNSYPDPQKFNSDFNSLSPDLIDFLASKNVCLVGIDTPSVDPEDDKELLTHNQIYKNDMAILEGIVLSQAPAGLYQLIALPLPMKDADASPVRAILIKG